MIEQHTPSRRISLKRNIVANYMAQIYITVVGIVMAPVYLSYMGTEAYGLVGFFTMMTAWFLLLDMGMTPTLVRETARYRGGAIRVDTLRNLLRALEIVFGSVSLVVAALMLFMARTIATDWLNAKVLPVEEVASAIMLMGLSVPLRWVAGLYRGLVSAFERQVWLGGYNVFIATLRFVGVMAIFTILGATPRLFFGYQLVVALIEVAGLAAMTYRLVGRTLGSPEKFSWAPLRSNLTFSLIIAFTTTVAVVVTQTDKLVLSKLLPLADYGMFALAIVAAGAINGIGGPYGQAVLPRLTKLVAERDDVSATGLYRATTQAVCTLVAPSVAVLCFFAEPILLAWTGKPDVARHCAPLVQLYAIGNGWLALCSVPYFLQYASGYLRLHLIGNALLVVVMLPLMVLAAFRFGAIGTGAVWAISNGAYVLCWVPLIHAKLLKERHIHWLTHDVASIVAPTFLVALLLKVVVPWPSGRWSMIALAALISLFVLAVAACGSSFVRHRARLMARAWITRVKEENG